MVSSDNLLCYSDWTITFTINTVFSDKQVVTAISHNKLIAIFSKRLTKPQRNHNTTEKEHLAIVE